MFINYKILIYSKNYNYSNNKWGINVVAGTKTIYIYMEMNKTRMFLIIEGMNDLFRLDYKFLVFNLS